MPTTIKRYAFDPTGQLVDNLITNEEHVLTGKNSQDFQLVIPRYAPYFFDSLEVAFRNPDGTERTLTRGKDWVYSHYFWQATHSLALPVYGGICFTNRNLTGIVIIKYQTLGGDWTIDTKQIEEILADRIHNPPVTTWEQVVNLPMAFPPIRHDFNVIDIYGPGHVIDALTGIERAIRDKPLNSGGGGGNSGNIPSLTKKQLGLDKVRNLETLPLNVSENTSDDFYLTPASLDNLLQYQHFKKLAQNQNFLDPLIQSLSFYTKQATDEKLSRKLGINDTAANSEKLGNRNTQQLADLILQGKAANAARFDGQTPAEFAVSIAQTLSTTIDSKIQDALGNANLSGGGGGVTAFQSLPANQNSYTLDLSRYTYFKVSIDHVPSLTFLNAPAGKAIEATIEVDTSMPAKSSLIGYERFVFNFTQPYHYMADISASKPGRKIIKVSTTDGGRTFFIRVYAAGGKFNGA